ncbi:uncharacterized protein METZ01_LOCUS347262 [marine metagenome]|uniref:DUF3310 domain-containing protein n=1 Tax=marine metagenome TaxID=408172 RepID=A0A382RBN8_9ZZZZ
MDQIERERSQKQKEQWHSYVDDNLVKSSKPTQQWDAQTQSYVNVVKDHIDKENEKMTLDPVGYELYNAPENTLPLGKKDQVDDQENIRRIKIQNWKKYPLKGKSKEELITEPNHYEGFGISPLEYITANELDFTEGNIIKYVSRYQFKGGVNDLLKAKTYLEKLIERERGKNE